MRQNLVFAFVALTFFFPSGLSVFALIALSGIQEGNFSMQETDGTSKQCSMSVLS